MAPQVRVPGSEKRTGGSSELGICWLDRRGVSHEHDSSLPETRWDKMKVRQLDDKHDVPCMRAAEMEETSLVVCAN
jgi:hypothetical protein